MWWVSGQSWKKSLNMEKIWWVGAFSAIFQKSTIPSIIFFLTPLCGSLKNSHADYVKRIFEILDLLSSADYAPLLSL